MATAQPAPARAAASDVSHSSTDDDNDHDDGADGGNTLGLGMVKDPKTGKAPQLFSCHEYEHVSMNVVDAWSEFIWLLCFDQVLSESAIMQRLRRMCRRRKSGKVPGGEDAHKQFQDMEKRPALAVSLVASGFNQEPQP